MVTLDQRSAYDFDRLVEGVAAAFEYRGYVSPWRDIARPGQLMPPLIDPWMIWLFMAGRGAGKTRSAAEAVAELMRRYPGCRVALVAPTFADGRDTMVEGESGLLSVLDDSELRGGSVDGAWNRSMGELYLANGSSAKVFSSEKPRKLRGPQHHVVWGDEPAVWKDANKDRGEVDTTWSNMMHGLRLPKRAGWPDDYRPRCILTTTPRRVALLKVAADVATKEPHRAGITQMPAGEVVVTTGTTDENLDNLAPEFIRNVVAPVQGTRLGRQELGGELLDDVEGALVSQVWIDRARLTEDDCPAFAAVVTAVDPATTAGETSDETGIVTVAADGNGEGYVIGDDSDVYTPDQWGRATWTAAYNHGSQAVVLEDNQGGDMAEYVLLTTHMAMTREHRAQGKVMPPRLPILRVHPSGTNQGKWVRAQPVGVLYEQAPGRVHHVGAFPRLEDQLTSWTGDKDEPSPDRVDAEVHGLSWLLYPKRRSQPKGTSQKRRTSAPAGGRWSADPRR